MGLFLGTTFSNACISCYDQLLTGLTYVCTQHEGCVFLCEADFGAFWEHLCVFYTSTLARIMPSKQRMRIANDKASKNVLNRGNVPKTLVRISLPYWIFNVVFAHCNFSQLFHFKKFKVWHVCSYWLLLEFE